MNVGTAIQQALEQQRAQDLQRMERAGVLPGEWVRQFQYGGELVNAYEDDPGYMAVIPLGGRITDAILAEDADPHS